MNNPRISVIIAVKNGQQTLEKCLSSVMNCDYNNLEVIVVDDGSTDKTLEILTKFLPKIKVITSPCNRGPSDARNIAACQALGEFIAFTDADCLVERHCFLELLSCFNNEKVVGAGGIQGIPDDESSFGRQVSEFMAAVGFITDYMRAPKTSIISVEHNASCNVMYKKSVFIEAGGFLSGLWPGEDVELDFRLRKKGYILKFNPAAKVCHYRVSTYRAFRRMLFRYGWAQGFLIKKYGFFRKVQYLSALPVVLIILLIISLIGHSLIYFLGVLLLCLFAVLRFNFKIVPLAILGCISWNSGFYNYVLFPKRSH